MKVYFAGAEIPEYQRRMDAYDVGHRSLSFARIKERPNVPYITKGHKYWLDHGLTFGKELLGDDELSEYVDAYVQFAQDNAESLHGVNEFDSLPPKQREYVLYALRGSLGDELVHRVWHVEDGRNDLRILAESEESFVVVGHRDIPKSSDVVSLLSKLSSQGHKIHIHMAPNIGDILRIQPASVSTMTWVSPLRFGDLVVPKGAGIITHGAPHSTETLIAASRSAESLGLNPQLIMEQDREEIMALAFGTLLRFESQKEVEKEFVLGTEADPSVESDVLPIEAPGTNPDAMRKLTTTLPVFKTLVKTHEDTGEEIPVLDTHSESMRQCDTCILSATCPAYKVGSACSFNLPVELRSPEQYRALVDALMEMQTARVAFGRFVEEISGNSLDPDVGREVDRLMKMLKTKSDLETHHESLTLSVEAQGSGGILSALFGAKSGAPPAVPASTDPSIIMGEIADQAISPPGTNG